MALCKITLCQQRLQTEGFMYVRSNTSIDTVMEKATDFVQHCIVATRVEVSFDVKSNNQLQREENMVSQAATFWTILLSRLL